MVVDTVSAADAVSRCCSCCHGSVVAVMRLPLLVVAAALTVAAAVN